MTGRSSAGRGSRGIGSQNGVGRGGGGQNGVGRGGGGQNRVGRGGGGLGVGSQNGVGRGGGGRGVGSQDGGGRGVGGQDGGGRGGGGRGSGGRSVGSLGAGGRGVGSLGAGGGGFGDGMGIGAGRGLRGVVGGVNDGGGRGGGNRVENNRVVSTPPGVSCNSGVQGDDNVDDYGHDNMDHGLDGIDDNEDQEISQVRRGSNTMHRPPSNPSLRIPLFITEDGHRFLDYGEAGHKITSILKNMYNGFWPTWSTVSNEEKDRLFVRFKMFFTWDSEIEVFIREIWSKHNTRRLSDSLCYARKIAIAKARSLGMEVENDYTPIIPFNPTWIKQTYWKRLAEEHWNLEKWKSISSTNSANRAHLIEGLHTTGSAGYDICRRRFVKSLKKKIGVAHNRLLIFLDTPTQRKGLGWVRGGRAVHQVQVRSLLMIGHVGLWKPIRSF